VFIYDFNMDMFLFLDENFFKKFHLKIEDASKSNRTTVWNFYNPKSTGIVKLWESWVERQGPW